MEKRMILFLIISVAIFVIWSYLFPPPPAQKIPAKQENTVTIKDSNNIPQPAYLSERFQEISSITESSTINENKEIVLENDVLKLVFSNRGAILKQAILKKYTDNNKNNIKLIDIKDNESLFPLGIFFNDNKLNQKLNLEIWNHEFIENNNKFILAFTKTDDALGLKFIKEFSIKKNDYLVTSNVSVTNLGAENKQLSPYKLLVEPALLDSESTKKEEAIATCVSGDINHTLLTKLEKSEILSLDEKTEKSWFSFMKSKKPKNHWISFTDKYFLISIIPGSNAKSLIIEKMDGKQSIGLQMDAKNIAAGTTINESNDIYFGPKEYDRLNALGKSIEDNIDFGFFGSLSKAVLLILNYLYKVIPNYGVAIILITLALKLITMPLTEKSFTSMKKMQKVQPHIDAAKEKHKNDPQRFNAEIMKIYKEHKVNPVGGCLPLLPQLPVFLALFNALNNSIELRHAPFMLWITDLSKPDTIISFGSSIPFINTISLNILPIFMILSMFVQQKMTTVKNPNATKEQEMQQKFLLLGMPLLFGVMMYGAPSGLVLYWFLSNVLGIAHQYYLNKKLSLQS